MLLIDGKLQPAQTQITPSKTQEAERLRARVDAFIKSGGTITQIPIGVSGARRDGGTPDARLSPQLAAKRRVNDQRNFLTALMNS